MATNAVNIVIDDMDATQLLTSSPLQMSTGSPVRRISSLSSLTIISNVDIDLTQFELMFTEDWFNTLSKARFCWSCKNYIDKAAPPDDMVVVHMEHFWIPPPQSKWSAVGHMQNRITHARHSCVIAKYPYFTPDLLEATIQVKDKLSPEHERYLADHLGVDFLNH